MTGPPSSGTPPSPGPPPPRTDRPRHGEGRVFWVALGISALLHLGLVWIYPALVREVELLPAGGAPEAVPEPEGTRIVTMRVVPDGELEEPEPVSEEERDPGPETAPAPVRPDAGPTTSRPLPEARAPVRAPTGAERLRVREADPRIWGGVAPERTELSDVERERIELGARLREWNDSVAVARARDAAARRWVHTDDEGGEWGVSPGRLHLGDLSLPLPSTFTFGTNSWLREDRADRAYQWTEIERGAEEALRRETLEERARAIRERRDRERADTTGSR